MKNDFKMLNINLQKVGSSLPALMLFLLMICSAMNGWSSNRNQNALTIHSWDGRDFTIEIQNKRFHSNGQITIPNLRSGQARVRIIRNQRTGYRNSGKGVLLYNGFINIPHNSNVKARLNRNKSVKVLSILRNNQLRPIRSNRPSSCGSNGNYSSGYENAPTIQYHEDYYEPYVQTPYTSEHTAGYGGACALDAHLFDQFMLELEEACFSDQKIRVTRQMLRSNYINTDQLIMLIEHMSFDKDQLDVAKLGYERITDPENIWRVYSAFTFSSTARKFEQWHCS